VSSQIQKPINKQNKPAADKQTGLKDLSRSPPSLDDTVTPQSASSSPLAPRINEPNKPAAKEAERKT
jgi:hypothetical protein